MLGVSDEALQRAAAEEQIRRRKARREHIAVTVLAGLASVPMQGAALDDAIKSDANLAVRYADALMAELDGGDLC
jgi:hypothetical protein